MVGFSRKLGRHDVTTTVLSMEQGQLGKLSAFRPGNWPQLVLRFQPATLVPSLRTGYDQTIGSWFGGETRKEWLGEG